MKVGTVVAVVIVVTVVTVMTLVTVVTVVTVVTNKILSFIFLVNFFLVGPLNCEIP